MKIIRVSTDMKVSVHEFPEGDHNSQNKALRSLIGDDCELYQMVFPRRLYTRLHHVYTPNRIPGRAVCMLIDEEGLLKEHPRLNVVGSYLYETDKHENPIVGNILFVGGVDSDGEPSFCGLSESTFSRLKWQLESIAEEFKTELDAAVPGPQKPENKGPKI